MFDAVIRKVENTVDTAVENIALRAVVAFLFLVAAGFATAALALWLRRQYGGETASVMLAALYAIIGAITWLVTGARAPADTSQETPSESASSDVAPDANEPRRPVSDTDRKFVYTALQSATPIVLPRLLRALLHNLPILAAIAGAIFVLWRAPLADQQPGTPAE